MAAAVAIIFIMPGCKPTEANYKTAYDAAKNRREAADRERMIPVTGLQSDDGPQLRVIDGDTVYVDRQVLRHADGRPPVADWYVAIGVFRMNTNAEASVSHIDTAGWPNATVLKGGTDRWYATADWTATLDSAKAVARRFMDQHPEYPFVGLPGAPVLVKVR